MILQGYAIRISLATAAVGLVPKITMALGRLTLDRSPGCTIAPILPGSTPIINDSLDVPSMAWVGLGTSVGSGWFPIVPGTLRPQSLQLGASLLRQQRLILLLGLALAL